MSANCSRFRTPGFPHSKYLQHSDYDWKFNNLFQYNLADGDCSKSEAVVAESQRVCQETQERTEKQKTQVERKFDERIADVDYWRKEGNKCCAKLQEGLDKLANLKMRLKQAMESLKEPIAACKRAMAERDKRLGVDMVQDRAQQEIQKYLLLLEETEAVLETTLQETEDREISVRAAKRRLMRDAADKEAALEIDTHTSSCRPENTASKGFKFDPHLMRPENTAVTMAEWERSTRHNIQKAEYEIKSSRDFWPRVEEMLGRTYADLTKQRLRVVSALDDRTRETRLAQERLEERLSRLQKQVIDVEDTLRKLDQSMDRKMPSMELASNRMEERRRRPRSELCRDDVDAELEEEVRQLSLSVHQLRGQSAQAREMLRRLEQTRCALQKEVEVKKNTLHIDGDICANAIANITHIRH